MGRPRNTQPTYRKHKGSGQAIVRLDGKTIYLGAFNSPESRRKYDVLMGEWLLSGRRGKERTGVTVTELIAQFWAFIVKDLPHTSACCYMMPCRMLKEMYGPELTMDFDPIKLRNIQQRLAATKDRRPQMRGKEQFLSRRYVDSSVKMIRRVFKWGMGYMLVPPNVFHSLEGVDPLRPEATTARESGKRKPADLTDVAAVKALADPTILAMIRLQELTGMRSGELVIMRTMDIDMTPTSDAKIRLCKACKPGQPCPSHASWVYTPSQHKNLHRGIDRKIFLNNLCQEILRPFLKMDQKAYLFSPMLRADRVRARSIEKLQQREAQLLKLRDEVERLEASADHESREKAAQGRREIQGFMGLIYSGRKHCATPLPKWGERFTTNSYNRNIWLLCQAANKLAHQRQPEIPADERLVKRWSPHQLRHGVASSIANDPRYGPEFARVYLGHANVKMTNTYIHEDFQKAAHVAAGFVG